MINTMFRIPLSHVWRGRCLQCKHLLHNDGHEYCSWYAQIIEVANGRLRINGIECFNLTAYAAATTTAATESDDKGSR